ncbi:hypothetical protein GS421_05790 [Rhodococcus hoagii]|nr:hypothetical protein [Prescottella equi]
MPNTPSVDSPVGPLTLVRNPEGLCGLYMHLQRHLPDGARFGPRTTPASTTSPRS